MNNLLTNIKLKSDNLKINETDLSVSLICELCVFWREKIKMKLWQENLLAMGITLLFMAVSGIAGYKQNVMQNVTFYFVIVIWLKQLSQKHT